MALLDPSNSHYVMHEKSWRFGGGDIYSPDGSKIGEMKRKIVSIRAEISLHDADGTLLCIINRKLVSARPVYDVKLPDGTLIGRGKRPMVAIRGSIDMYDAEEKLIYKAQGGLMKFDFEITDATDNRVLATIKKGDRWRDVFAKSFSFKDRYVIRIEDSSADRLMLLAYAVIIDNVYHDK
jgi:uncharacterized protein YxjI